MKATRVDGSLVAVQLAGFMSERRRIFITNDSQTGTLKLRIDAKPTATLFTELVLPGQTWRDTTRADVYGLWDVVDGGAIVTEEF